MNISNKKFESWNEEMARKYNPENYHKSSNIIIRFIENARVKKIINYLDLQKNDRVIELGCGAGNIIQKIKSAKEIMGIDLSDFLLGLAKKKKKYPRAVKFIKGNIEDLPQEVTDFKFDKIYCSEVLEHVRNPDKVLEEIRKIAKKDSIIVISIPNEVLINKTKRILQRLKLFNLLFSNFSKKMDDEWHLHSFDLVKLKRMVRNNYIIEKARGIPFNFLPLRYVVKLRLKND